MECAPHRFEEIFTSSATPAERVLWCPGCGAVRIDRTIAGVIQPGPVRLPAGPVAPVPTAGPIPVRPLAGAQPGLPFGTTDPAAGAAIGAAGLAPGREVAGAGQIAIFCDGACSGNPGPGGYGVIIRLAGGEELTVTGGAEHTTNNRMEMQGALAGLARLAGELGLAATDRYLGAVEVVSDSQLLVRGMNEWLPGWQRKGYKKVANAELWQELAASADRFARLTFTWVAGHNGHPENEACDRLARQALKSYGR